MKPQIARASELCMASHKYDGSISKFTYMQSTGIVYVELNDKCRTTVVFPSSTTLYSFLKAMEKILGKPPINWWEWITSSKYTQRSMF